EVRYQGARDAAKAASGGAERVEFFAVNVDAEEGDLTRIDKRELSQLVPELKFDLVKDRGASVFRASAGGQDANELWRYGLWAVLALLPLESILAMRFGRRAAA
ncbi:MAG TPA: hypothetical protein VHF22_05480, partial [Planctomycetota bacterium]|nr:hypothetical protein [Planctomycetota bacterium]